MQDLTLTKTRIRAGMWEGILRSGSDLTAEPELEVLHLETPVAGVAVQPAPGHARSWHVRIPIPADLLSDGVQTFLIRDRKTGDALDSFAIVTGAALEDDIRAEIDLLRAELDMLKKAFRRHCLETMG